MTKEVALLGIDGVGKSTIAAAFLKRLNDLGTKASVTSWSSCSRHKPEAFERSCLGDLLFTAFRGMYAAAEDENGLVKGHFPDTVSEFLSSDVRDRFLDFNIVHNEAWGVLSGVLTEIAGNFTFKHMDVEPKLKAGHVVIQETFGYKHAVKDLYLAKTLARRNGNEEFLPLIDQLEQFVERLFTTVLAPQTGFVIDGDPVVAIERRLAQSGRAGWTENMQLACDTRPESFLQMQQYTRDKFLNFAEKHGWPVITINNEGKEKNVERAIDIMMRAIDISSELATVSGH